MKIYFSDFFDVSPNVLEEYGAFNISLINDLPLFIDPFLIFCGEKEEYQELHHRIMDYLIFLRDQAQDNPILDPGMMKLYYIFPEVKQTYLGFCNDGNEGKGLGKDFAIALHAGLKDIFVLKETGELIGMGGLVYNSENDVWKLGYNLRKAYEKEEYRYNKAKR